MKLHAIIPIFIPQEGCPNDCVFCNQKKITARQQAPSEKETIEIVDRYLSTLRDPRPEIIEIAMYGGSFTGLPIEQQKKYLQIALDYKKKGIIDRIHLSTRPDYIDCDILDLLKSYEVDIIELGVQSFDDRVLALSGRGHNSAVVYESCRLIQGYGFTLGIQLMIGLPGDTRETAIYSAMETVKIAPSIARLYPTVIIADTELYEMHLRGAYISFSMEELVSITKDMYQLLTGSGIQVIRVGLKSSDIIHENGDIAGHNYHPAFRQLVEGEIAKEQLEQQLQAFLLDFKENGDAVMDSAAATAASSAAASTWTVTFASNPRWFSNMIGNGGRNKRYFKERYPNLRIQYKTDPSLQDGCYRVTIR